MTTQKTSRKLLFALSLPLMLAACNDSEAAKQKADSVNASAATPVASPVPPPVASSTPVPPLEFPKGKIKLGGKTIIVEIANNPELRARGLMYRTELPENQGMLFEFDYPDRQSFWMKNTLIPLSIGYFDSDRKLAEVYEMEPAVLGETRPKTYPSLHPVLYALEMPKGWYTRNKVKPGAVFTYLSKPEK